QIRWQTLAAILDALPTSEHKFLYRVSNTNAAIYWREPVRSSALPLVTLPNKTFKMEISATPFHP
ncbi:MAG: class I SAM-dependent methyltransferase, partial [Chloroherpetonaceae bacterium]